MPADVSTGERFISEFVVGFNWTAARAFRRTLPPSSIGGERGGGDRNLRRLSSSFPTALSGGDNWNWIRPTRWTIYLARRPWDATFGAGLTAEGAGNRESENDVLTFEIVRVMSISATSDTDLEQKIFSSLCSNFFFSFSEREIALFEATEIKEFIFYTESIFYLFIKNKFPSSKFLFLLVIVALWSLLIYFQWNSNYSIINLTTILTKARSVQFQRQKERKLYVAKRCGTKENRYRISRSY